MTVQRGRPTRGPRTWRGPGAIPRQWAWLFLAGATLVLVLGAWGVQGARWRGPLYCIGRPGTLWNGAAPLPRGAVPTCPASQSYRREVRAGLSRVEQYRLAGWQPMGLLAPLRRAGYVLRHDELNGETGYAVFLGRTVPAELHYTAVREGAQTLVTISGK